MKKQQTLITTFIVLLTIIFQDVNAQSKTNQMDSNGKRHGVWKKYYS